MVKKSVGYNIENMPKESETYDKKSPFHGTVKIRGKTFEGVVVSDSMAKTVKVEWETLVKDSKFNRYLKKRTKVSAHNPDSISAKVGDKVLIGETRPLSKTKHFAVIKIVEARKE